MITQLPVPLDEQRSDTVVRVIEAVGGRMIASHQRSEQLQQMVVRYADGCTGVVIVFHYSGTVGIYTEASLNAVVRESCKAGDVWFLTEEMSAYLDGECCDKHYSPHWRTQQRTPQHSLQFIPHQRVRLDTLASTS